MVVHGRSAGSMGARLDKKMCSIGNDTNTDMFKLKISKLAKLAKTKCVLARQLMQSVYCAPAR